MAWMILLAAGICEVVWAIGLKLYGFRPTAGGAMTVKPVSNSFS